VLLNDSMYINRITGKKISYRGLNFTNYIDYVNNNFKNCLRLLFSKNATEAYEGRGCLLARNTVIEKGTLIYGQHFEYPQE